jgi:hypothetical protein
MGKNFWQKAWLIANGNQTEAPPTLTYSFVCFLWLCMHCFPYCHTQWSSASGLWYSNAYLTVNCRKHIYTIIGPKFGSKAGSVMIVKKALYGLKSSGTAFCAHLVETLFNLNY